MKRSAPFALTFAIWAASLSAAFATEASAPEIHAIHRRVHYRLPAVRDTGAARTAAQSAPAPVVARPQEPPAVQNNSDGLSRDPEDCNMGCIDNTQ
jgi:hypothetical protein